MPEELQAFGSPGARRAKPAGSGAVSAGLDALEEPGIASRKFASTLAAAAVAVVALERVDDLRVLGGRAPDVRATAM